MQLAPVDVRLPASKVCGAHGEHTRAHAHNSSAHTDMHA